MDDRDTDVQAALLPQIHRSHSHVLPGADEERFATAVERALLDVLGESDARKVCAHVSAGNAKAPASQLALMWMSAHMPRAATKVLAVARSYYGEEAAA